VFDDATARGSAIPSPSEGMLTYNKDTSGLELYDGSAFGPVGSDAALIHINTTTTGGNVASISIDNVFSSSYDNYLVEIYGTFVSADFANLRLRVGGADNSTASSYLRQSLQGSSTSATASSESNTSFRVAFRGTTNAAMGRIYIYRPFLTLPTLLNNFAGSESNTTMQHGYHNQSTSYDGFSIITNTNQFDATLITYGLRK
jgi:hypothetical protein